MKKDFTIAERVQIEAQMLSLVMEGRARGSEATAWVVAELVNSLSSIIVISVNGDNDKVSEFLEGTISYLTETASDKAVAIRKVMAAMPRGE